VSRFSGVLSRRFGRKLGVEGTTIGPVSSCQLPRASTRTVIGSADSVMSEWVRPLRVARIFAAS
jgi:hypothetical protein